MYNLTDNIVDGSKGARNIAKKFLIHDVADQFVTQISRTDNNKKVSIKTHGKFVQCISSEFEKEL